jgi:hypothetical protein
MSQEVRQSANRKLNDEVKPANCKDMLIYKHFSYTSYSKLTICLTAKILIMKRGERATQTINGGLSSDQPDEHIALVPPAYLL